MILFELVGLNEEHAIYQKLEIANGRRQYDFLRSLVQMSLDLGRPFLSAHIVKALNYHAITCLHTNAGEYRPCGVVVGADGPDPYHPPDHYRVDSLMEDFINSVNRMWGESVDVVGLAAFVLWRLNHIHPFINGNGRTARAASYFVLCVSMGRWLPGQTILPELLRQHRNDYVDALKKADESLKAGNLDLTALHALMLRLFLMQMDKAPPAT